MRTVKTKDPMLVSNCLSHRLGYSHFETRTNTVNVATMKKEKIGSDSLSSSKDFVVRILAFIVKLLGLGLRCSMVVSELFLVHCSMRDKLLSEKDLIKTKPPRHKSGRFCDCHLGALHIDSVEAFRRLFGVKRNRITFVEFVERNSN